MLNEWCHNQLIELLPLVAMRMDYRDYSTTLQSTRMRPSRSRSLLETLRIATHFDDHTSIGTMLLPSGPHPRFERQGSSRYLPIKLFPILNG